MRVFIFPEVSLLTIHQAVHTARWGGEGGTCTPASGGITHDVLARKRPRLSIRERPPVGGRQTAAAAAAGITADHQSHRPRPPSLARLFARWSRGRHHVVAAPDYLHIATSTVMSSFLPPL